MIPLAVMVDDVLVIRKKEDRVLTGRQPWELRSCELVFASVEVLHSVAAGPPRRCCTALAESKCADGGCAFYLFIRVHRT